MWWVLENPRRFSFELTGHGDDATKSVWVNPGFEEDLKVTPGKRPAMCKSSKSSHGLPITTTVGVARVLPSGKVYRQIFDDEAKESESVIAAREVRGLADVIDKRTSDIVERIYENKKLCYEEVVAQFKQELACVGKLQESDQAFEAFFRISESDVTLISYTIEDFERMWALLFQETQQRRQWIRDLDEALHQCEADLKRDSFYRLQLEERKEVWKVVQKKHIISSFRSLLPLKHTKAEINEWYESLVELNKRIDTHNVQSMMRIRLQYEKVCQECLEKLQESKQNLIDMKICTPKEAEKIVNPSFYQLIGELQLQFEVKIEKMDADLEYLVKNTEINCRHLYQYFQDVLAIFDVHQQKLTQQDNELQKALNDCRCKHENMNKLREMNLDIAVDKLRMQSTDEKLKAYLEKVYAALDIIRNGYTAFHQDLLSKVIAYPRHVRHQLLCYSATISRYFYVLGSYKGKTLKKSGGSAEGSGEDREPTEETKEVEETEEAVEILLEKESEEELLLEEGDAEGPDSIEEEEREEMEASARRSGKIGIGGDDVERAGEGNLLGPKAQGPPSQTCLLPSYFILLQTKESDKESKRKDVIVEFFTTSSENTYKVVEHLKKSKLRKPEKYYLGKLKSSSLPSYVEQVYLSEAFFRDVRRHIRLQFFEHLEQWFDDTLASTWVMVVVKKEELNTELQLRFHLHEPRRERIEKDVYNVRMAELQIHNNRLKRHCAGLIEALNKERGAFIKIREDHNTISKSFRNRIQEMEKVFQMESRAEKVMALSRNLHMELLNHVEVLQVFMKQLQKENSRIEFVEGLIMIDMEKAETGYLEQATETISKFENRFRYLAMDRVFLERIQRFLTNIQVKIKTESITPDRLYEFTKSVMEELKKRCKYLNCQLRIQDSVVSSALSDMSLLESRVIVMGMEYTPVLNPSRMGKPPSMMRPLASSETSPGLCKLPTKLYRPCSLRAVTVKAFHWEQPIYCPRNPEFYKKDKHQITKPDCLQETYDLCIDALGQKMLTYLFQSDEYHIACISEFRVQLKTFEEELPRVVCLAIGKILKDHEQFLAESMEQIRALCQEEERRQEEQVESILICTRKLEVCVTECAQRFVSTLATCTETILMELDNSLTIDDVQVGKTEKVREKTITLIRRKKAGLSLEVEERKLVAERGSRTWPGIPQTTNPSLPDQVIFPETASKFKETLKMEFARIKEENTAHLMKTQHWAHWWKKSVQKIKQLYYL
ncbi:hypothetical protein E2320_006663 [Naja naja]|nr:hypothetical protein E2320_006663 [Naja naja]